MTREEAIEALTSKDVCNSDIMLEALDMAIKALEQEPCEDVISRQAVVDAIEHGLAEPAYQHTGEDWYVGMNSAESILYDLPSVQPKAKTGHWIVDSTSFSEMNGYILHCHCSKCHYTKDFYDSKSWSGPCIENAETFNFCPNCGADMRGEE